jgi:hypothetical protein
MRLQNVDSEMIKCRRYARKPSDDAMLYCRVTCLGMGNNHPISRRTFFTQDKKILLYVSEALSEELAWTGLEVVVDKSLKGV